MIDNIASGLFDIYSYVLKDWLLIISCLVISLRIPLKLIKPFFTYLWDNFKKTANFIADLADKEEKQCLDGFVKIMRNDWYKFFIFPILIGAGIILGIRIVRRMTKVWMLLSLRYKTSVFLPWIKDINQSDKYNVFGIICLVIQLYIEIYQYKVCDNKKKKISYILLVIMYIVQTIIYGYIPVKYVVIFVTLELWGYFNKIKYYKIPNKK